MISVKNFVIAIFAVLFFIVGLLAIIFEFIALIDPEGAGKFQHFVTIITAIFAFLIGWLLWKLSRAK